MPSEIFPLVLLVLTQMWKFTPSSVSPLPKLKSRLNSVSCTKGLAIRGLWGGSESWNLRGNNADTSHLLKTFIFFKFICHPSTRNIPQQLHFMSLVPSLVQSLFWVLLYIPSHRNALNKRVSLNAVPMLLGDMWLCCCFDIRKALCVLEPKVHGEKRRGRMEPNQGRVSWLQQHLRTLSSWQCVAREEF